VHSSHVGDARLGSGEGPSDVDSSGEKPSEDPPQHRAHQLWQDTLAIYHVWLSSVLHMHDVASASAVSRHAVLCQESPGGMTS
jgi:hypothetical protein